MELQTKSELSAEETLTRTFDLYLRDFAIFFVPVLTLGIVTSILSLLVTFYFPVSPLDLGNTAELLSSLPSWLLALFLVTFVTELVSWILSTFANGICVKCASDLMEKGTTSLTASVRFTRSRFLPLLGAAIITGLSIILGTIAFIVPGIILSIMFFLVNPAIIIENSGTLRSLSRSQDLVRNRWFKTFAVLLIVYFIVLLTSYLGSLLTSPLGLFGPILSAIITAIAAPLIPIAATVHYYSMLGKEKKLNTVPVLSSLPRT